MAHAPVKMFVTASCPYCIRAEALLRSKGVDDMEIIRVDLDPPKRQAMIDITGRRTVPQIFIGATHVGGSDDLTALDRSGDLDRLLQGVGA